MTSCQPDLFLPVVEQPERVAVPEILELVADTGRTRGARENTNNGRVKFSYKAMTTAAKDGKARLSMARLHGK